MQMTEGKLSARVFLNTDIDNDKLYDMILCLNIEIAYATINFQYLTNSNNLVSYITFSAHSRRSV